MPGRSRESLPSLPIGMIDDAGVAFDQMFSEADIVVLVDEWKAAKVATEPLFFVARAFTDVGRSTRRLYRLLVANRASEWHASGARAETSCLLTSPDFQAIMTEVSHADTSLYEHLFLDLADYDKGGAAIPNWLRITAEKALGEAWSPHAPRQAKALFWFLEALLRSMSVSVGRDVRIRVIVDRQDWLTRRASRLETTVPGCVLLGGREDAIQAEVLAIADKKDSGVAPYLPLLGLVDSEAWASGAILALKLSDGTRAYDRCMAWLSAGRGDATVLLAELKASFERVHGAHANLDEYLRHAWEVWNSGRRVDLNRALQRTRSPSQDTG